MSAGRAAICFDFEPYRLSGNVYGALLNHRSALTELGPKVAEPPYNAAPRAPVLYVKPRNTLARIRAMPSTSRPASPIWRWAHASVW